MIWPHVMLCSLLQVGVIQTAYANGASTAYIQQTLGLKVECTPTGEAGRGGGEEPLLLSACFSRATSDRKSREAAWELFAGAAMRTSV